MSGDVRNPGRELSRSLIVLLALFLFLWLWLCWPLLTGAETLYFRDVFHSHFPFKAFGAHELAEGRIPAFNPTWALGQPFRGNPNTLAFYPGNLFYLVLPFWPAFNLHYCLHWLMAGVGMFALARGLGQSRPAATLAGLTYAGSGFLLSAMTFYNILTVVAWWPLVILGAVKGGRRGLAIGSVACGMALLGGEPVTAALGVVPLAAIAFEKRGPRAGLLATLWVGVGGLALALPQIVATLRVMGFSFRGTHGVLASQASFYSLDLVRLLELLLPFPAGVPGYYGPMGSEAAGVLDHLPFFYSIYWGIIGLLLALLVLRRRRVVACLAGAGVLFSWLGGFSGEVLLGLSGGLFRSPEKLLFWAALSVPLLAGWGLEAATSGDALRRARIVAGGGLVVVAAGGVVAAVGGSLGRLLLARGEGFAVSDAVVGSQVELWWRGLAVGGLLLLLAAWAVWRRWPEALVALQFLALLQLMPLWMTDAVAEYDQPRWKADAGGRTAVSARMGYPPWRLPKAAQPAFPEGPRAPYYRLEALELSPAPGVLHGLSYPLAPDLEGMHHLFYNLLTVKMAEARWSERTPWLRVLGADLLASPEPVSAPELELLARSQSYGTDSWLYAIEDPAPAVFWPERLEVAHDPGDAFARVASAQGPTLVGVVPEPLEHAAGGRVRLLVAEPDRLAVEVEGGGGLVIIRRAFQPLFQASIGARRLPILPANLCLLGVVVPPGKHTVEVTASAWPEIAAGVVSGLLGVALVAMAVGARRSPSDRR